MGNSAKHDPLTAISEAEATGETAAIFSDIRATMRLPQLTSIWRTLASVEGGLVSAWQATKPLFESGLPEASLSQLLTPECQAVPTAVAKRQFEALQLSTSSLGDVRNIIATYTRSNSLNLLALSALIAEPAVNVPERPASPPAVTIPKLPVLLEQNDILPSTWHLLNEINRFGASPDEPGLATLWRHLAHWPDVLSVIHSGLAPLQENGTIANAVSNALEVASVAGQHIAALRSSDIPIPEPALAMITKYVTHPGLVVRMVVIGNGLATWMDANTHNAYD